MAPTALVNPQIEAGQKALDALEEDGLKIRTAFWGRLAESREWRLFLVAPRVDAEGPRDVYKQIQRSLDRHQLKILVWQVTVVGPHDPVAQEVRRVLGPSELGSTSILSSKSVGGELIEDAYV